MGKCGSSRGGGGSGICPNPLRDNAEFKKLVKYLNDPLQINTIRKMVVTENEATIREHFMGECGAGSGSSDVIKNGFIYTTCLFCYSKNGGNGWNQCKNSREGRSGTLTLKDGNSITYCYPDIKSIKHRIQIGLHINFVHDAKTGSIHFDCLQNGNRNGNESINGRKDQKAVFEDSSQSKSLVTVVQASVVPVPVAPVPVAPVPEKRPLISPSEIPVAPAITLISLTSDEKSRVNEMVLKENIALKAHIRLLQMNLMKIQGIIQDQTMDIVGSFMNGM